jgi:hypothetical protein
LTEEQIEELNLPDLKIEQVTRDAKNLFSNIVMPLLLLTIRLETDVIFHLAYYKFFNNIGLNGKKSINEPKHVLRANRLMNGVITEVLDPNLYYSRLSFLESGKDAIDIKNQLILGKHVGF